MRRSIGIFVVGATTAIGLAFIGPAEGAPKGTLTNFTADAVSYGSRTVGDPNNVRSGATAAAYFPCTRYVPRETNNFVNTVTRGDTRLTNVRSRNFSAAGPISVTATNTAQSGTLGRGGLVTFTNLSARVRVYHNGSGFHVTPVSSLGSLKAPLIKSGPSVPIALTGRRQTVPVPGQGTLYLNYKQHSKGTHRAGGAVNVIRFVKNDGTTVKVGRASAQLSDGVTRGVFSGAAWGSQSKTGNLAATGRTALKPIACPGTRGKAISTTTGQTTLGSGFAGVQKSTVYGVQGRSGANGYTHSRVDRARFGGGALVLRNIDAWARVTRNRNGSYDRSDKGTGVGKILVNGSAVPTPKPGVSRKVAGLGTFTVAKVNKDPNGLEVVGVEVRLFNGSKIDTIVRLANAKLHIKRG